MNVGIAYADKFKQVWLKLDVPDDSTVREAIEHSGMLDQFPDIDLEKQKVGIFGKITKLTPVMLESMDSAAIGPHGRCIWFTFKSAGHLDGFDFKSTGRLVTFDIKVNSRSVSPAAIWIGGGNLHPPHSAFRLQR